MNHPGDGQGGEADRERQEVGEDCKRCGGSRSIPDTQLGGVGVYPCPDCSSPPVRAIRAIDNLLAYLQESGLAEEGGGLALYGRIKILAEARADLAANLLSQPDTGEGDLTRDDGERLGSIAESIQFAIEEGFAHPDFADRDARYLRQLSKRAFDTGGDGLRERYEAALKQIAGCESRHPSDVVAIARTALGAAALDAIEGGEG